LLLLAITQDLVHDDLAPKPFKALVEDARRLADHTLSETDWKGSQCKREESNKDLDLGFNIDRLISVACL